LLFSCGDELAVGVKARLPFGLADGGGSFFLEQRRKNEQRKNGFARERSGFVRGAAERRDKFNVGHALQFLREQFLFQLLKFIFLRRAKWRGRIGGPIKPRGRRELAQQSIFSFHLFFLSFIGGCKTKNPRLLSAIAGLKI
jgi:hypothetical protein